ncbi:hypothetical protein LINPERPRIM_LOCUS1289 [Linum perenne]
MAIRVEENAQSSLRRQQYHQIQERRLSDLLLRISPPLLQLDRPDDRRA